MSVSTAPMRLKPAHELAIHLGTQLQEGCDRLQIVGSIRRGKSIVNDIEIICIARFFFFDSCICEMLDDGLIVPTNKNGLKYKQFTVPKGDGIKLDLFIVAPETWGVLLAIRTGPAGFSQRMVTQKCFGGLLSDGLNVIDGRVWRDNQALDTPEERDFMELCGGWIDPEKRI